MSDIAKCLHDECPRHEQCYRWTAPDDDKYQTYAQPRVSDDGTCEDFLPNETEGEEPT